MALVLKMDQDLARMDIWSDLGFEQFTDRSDSYQGLKPLNCTFFILKSCEFIHLLAAWR